MQFCLYLQWPVPVCVYVLMCVSVSEFRICVCCLHLSGLSCQSLFRRSKPKRGRASLLLLASLRSPVARFPIPPGTLAGDRQSYEDQAESVLLRCFRGRGTCSLGRAGPKDHDVVYRGSLRMQTVPDYGRGYGLSLRTDLASVPTARPDPCLSFCSLLLPLILCHLT